MIKLKEPIVCEQLCVHTDCNALKSFVENAKCSSCKEKILPNERYYDDNNILTHFRCIDKQ